MSPRFFHEITSVVLRVYERPQVRESGHKVRDIHELVARNVLVIIMYARLCMFVNSTMLCSCLSRSYLVPNIVNFTNIQARSEHALEDSEHADDLLLVTLNGAGDLLGGEEEEPARLTKVRATGIYEHRACAVHQTRSRRCSPLAGRLEEEPLGEGCLLLLVADRQFVLLVVLVDEVEKDRVALPDCEVTVVMVD